jgi:hypothetical protein
MIRNLKVMGLVLGAFFAMSALGASAASAAKITIAGGVATTLTGTDTVGQKSVLQFNANQTFLCHGHYDIGKVTTFAQTTGSHPAVENGAETVTVVPTYSQCEAFLNGSLVGPATVTNEGCDFDIAAGVLSGGKAPTSSSLRCPTGKSVIVHVYTNSTHASNICTFTFGAAGNEGKTGAFLQNEAGGKLTLGGKTTGIKVSRTGLLCGGTAETTTASVEAHVIISSTSGAALSLS